MYPEHTDNEKRLLDSIITPAKIRPRVKGRFKLRAMKGDIIMRESAWSPNLIVNSYFNELFTRTTVMSVAGFLAGSGTGTPSETDTALESYLGGGNSFQDAWVTRNTTVSPRSITQGVRIRAAEGAVVGNVSEVALYWHTSGSALAPNSTRSIMNRARVTDELGSPTTISVLADEFLEVVWELVLYAVEGATGTLTIDIDGTPTNFDYEIQPVYMASQSQWLSTQVASANFLLFSARGQMSATTGAQAYSFVGEQTSFLDPSGSGNNIPNWLSSHNFTSNVMEAYIPGSKQRSQTIRVPLNNGNFAAPGIRSIFLGLVGGATTSTKWSTHQMLLDGPFVKPNTHIFDLPITVSMGNA